MNKNLFFRLLLGLALVLAFCTSCATAKSSMTNTGTWIKEGGNESDQSMANLEDIGARVQDASISSEIKTRFAGDKLVSSSDINVDTTGGHVTLNGSVDSQAEVTRAVEIGRAVDGVKSVHSNLVTPLRRK
jgi:hyperosmotically inducible periplasmic protein